MGSKFIKKKEDFTCEKCGTLVIGDGYTNHCPNCIYSKHVDINPGDRAEKCEGLMKPISVEGTQKNYRVNHKCIVCGHAKQNKLSDRDSIDEVTKIIARYAK